MQLRLKADQSSEEIQQHESGAAREVSYTVSAQEYRVEGVAGIRSRWHAVVLWDIRVRG